MKMQLKIATKPGSGKTGKGRGKKLKQPAARTKKVRQQTTSIGEDITERRQAEETIRASEKRFRALIENGQDNISLLSADGTLLWESPATIRSLGYAQNEFVNRSIFELIHPDDQNWTVNLFAQLIKEPGSRQHGVFRLRHRDGTWRWNEATVSNMLNEASVNAIVVNYRDITERKQAEDKLRLSDQFLQRVNALVLVADAQGSIVYLSPATRTILGYEPDELLGDNWWKFTRLDPIQARHEKEYVGRAARGEIPIVGDAYERAIQDRSGNTRWISWVDAAGPTGLLIGVGHDITERKQAEDSLQKSETILSQAGEIAHLGAWEIEVSNAEDLNSNPLHWSDETYRIFGYEPDEVPSSNALFFEHIHPEDRQKIADAVSRAIAEKRSYEIEHRLIRLDGSERIVFEHADVTYNEKGQPLRILGAVQDITERKRAEEALHESEQRYRALFEDSPVSIWEEDFSQLKKHLDTLKEKGITDLRAYFASHPEAFFEYASMIRIVDVNNTALQMYHADSKEQLIESTTQVLSKGEQEHNLDDFIAIAEGKTSNSWEGADRTLTGEPIEVSLKWSVAPGYEADFSKVIVTVIDITERKQVENELRASEERFRQLANNIQEVFWITDSLARKDLYLSPAYEVVWGRGLEGQMENSNVFVESILPEDRPAVLTALEKQVHGEKTEMEYRISRPDGSVRWIWDRAFPIFDETGRVKNVAGIAADITDRKQAENALRESEERFSNAFEFAPIGMALVSLDGHWLRINQATCEITGYSAKELLEKTFQDITHPEDLDEDLNSISRMLAGEIQFFQMEKRYFHKLGHTVWVQLNVSLVRDDDGRPLYFISQIQNITERKQSEGEIARHLIELEALYENGLAVGRLLEPPEIGARIIETFDRYFSWHHVAIRLRQGESDDLELVAFNMPNLKEEDKVDVERKFNAKVSKVGQGLSGWVVQNGVPIRAGNVHLYPQYVDTYKEIWSGIYMPLKVGERIIGCISVESELPDAFTAQDERLLATLANQTAVAFENARLFQAAQKELSERIRAEEMLERERTSLAQRVEERTVDLSRAKENLERALRVKDEFLANMSHELRTPLNAILGLSESLAEQVAGPLNTKQQNYITTISESGHHLLALINDILDLAKIEAGQITLDITKVDVHSVCQASLRMVKQQAQKKNQDITLEIDENFGLIWADERRLKQMIVNLLSNAVKFTPDHGKIGLEVHGDKDENRVLITVWDHGIGVEDDDLSLLFQPFVQLDSGLARESSGTGLGLALVAQMARLHGGSVSIASVPGEGSRFTLVIPWQPALSADTIERMKVTGKFRAIKMNPGRQKTILLIEDTEEVILVVRDYLELAGYTVAVARDGLEGIAQAKITKPDLILMDLQMPRMDGIEATQKLRGEPDFQLTPIIALTALAMPNDRERCLAAGMDEYITKPVNLRALVKIIQGFLSAQEEIRPQ